MSHSHSHHYHDFNIYGGRVHFGNAVNGAHSVASGNQEEVRRLKLLNWLAFPRMHHRRETIKAAHQDTFRWILNDEKNGCERPTGFAKWLKQEEGVYWISGKAGSEKSTLMKTIQKDSRTESALKKWARDKPIFCPSFYFHYLGTDQERSKLGLLRSLLHQLLTHFPNRVPLVLPDWQPEHATVEPAYEELVGALQQVLTCGRTERYTCFFVDGLDEYEGNTIDLGSLAEFLIALTEIPRVKLVLSSRPLLTLGERFELGPHLRLQDLTRPDIDKFVADNLSKNRTFLSMQSDSPEDAQKLLDALGERAEGVFLWVHVVVINLLDGLTNRDTISVLMARLSELPRELEDLFRVIMDRIPSRYERDAFRLLYLALTWVLDRQYRISSRALTLHLALRYQHIHPWEYSDTERAKADMRSWLRDTAAMVNARCLGLLEVDDKVDTKACALDKSPRINFLHRTVADYLNDATVRDRLKTTAGLDFDVNVATASALAMILKAKLEASKGRFERTEQQLASFMHFSRLAEASDRRAQTEIMDDVERSLSARYPDADNWPDRFIYFGEERYRASFTWQYSFLPLAIASGCTLYSREKLKHEGFKWQPKRPFLLYAVSPQPVESPLMYGINPDVVEDLLARGADPNDWISSYHTVWQLMLHHLRKCGFSHRTRVHSNGIAEPQYCREVLAAVKSMLVMGQIVMRSHRQSNPHRTAILRKM